jgi:hypothetical protein
LGITGAGGKVMIFRRGEMIRTVAEENALEVFFAELEGM